MAKKKVVRKKKVKVGAEAKRAKWRAYYKKNATKYAQWRKKYYCRTHPKSKVCKGRKRK